MKFSTFRNFAGIISITILFYLLLTQIEEGILYNMVYPLAGMTVDNWISEFRSLAIIGLLIAFGSSLLWYISAEWFMKVNSIKNAKARLIWFLIYLIPIITAVVTAFLLPSTKSGSVVSTFIQVVNVALSYYLSTLLFSPSAFKYTPPLAKFFRRW